MCTNIFMPDLIIPVAELFEIKVYFHRFFRHCPDFYFYSLISERWQHKINTAKQKYFYYSVSQFLDVFMFLGLVQSE